MTDSRSAVTPPASLIIPSVNRGQLLIDTVDSVLAGDEVPAEMIIVDQSDRSSEELAARTSTRCDVRYVWTRDVGASRARNTGVRLARHALLGFIDDDIRVAPDWFGCLTRAAVSAGPRAVITGRVLPERPASPDGFVPSTITDESTVVYEGRIGVDILYSNNMMLHRTAFDEVGLFDERLGGGARFPTAEDNDLAHRLLEAGYRIIYAPEAVVEHRAWRSGRDYLPLRWSYGRGQGAFYAKHLDLRDRYILRRAGHDVGHNSSRFFRFLFRDPRRAAGQVVHVAAVVSAMAQWLVSRPREP
jgi:GT2 family glycosyltransferase